MKNQHRRKRPKPAAKPGRAVEGSAVAAGSIDPPPFPIVGIGASAGGLEALEQFLKHVPERCDLTFVVVQHLDPTHEDIMVELLQRTTTMPVLRVKDRLRVKPGCVYVIPPNRDMSLLHGVLHLLEPVAPRGQRLPIDFFFCSLAEDLQERSVGIILSGMGRDGTLGLRAIKEQAGVALVQEPASAKFDGMPCSAIASGVADIVAPPEELPIRLLAFLKHKPLAAQAGLILEAKAQSALEKVSLLLRSHTGHDFSHYKKSTVYRRVERRMGLHQIDRIAGYVRYLQENRQEVDLLFKELLIGVTSFFRDPGAWEQLKTQGFSSLLARPGCGRTLRAWVPGCSSGEEAYSLAIVFKEAVEQLRPPSPCLLQVFATDLDRDAIDRARRGVFPANIVADVAPERLARFFTKEEDGYRVGKEIREMVIFAPQNVITDPPFTKLDLITCRNLLIYLEPELQRKVVSLFHFSLNPGGLLFLGSAESVGGYKSLFTPFGAKHKLFRRKEAPESAEPFELPSSPFSMNPIPTPEPAAAKAPVSLQALAEQALLQQHCPPAVLVNDEGDILFIHGRTGRYLEPTAGKANWNLFAMVREGLRYELVGAFRKVVRRGGDILLRNCRVGINGGTQVVEVGVHRLEEPAALRGMVLVVFTEVIAPKKPTKPGRTAAAGQSSANVAGLEQDLQKAREELQSAREEMQTSQEELRSINEELQSTNEELQSTNEELTTSKEEMQSLNEELQTVNAELQARVTELSRANNDMKNLLNSTEIATVFLDNGLNVRRFTTAAARIIKLIPGDVGRPVTDLASTLLYPDLAADAQLVLQTLVFTEKQVATRGGEWFAVRIMPYRTVDNVIDGVVITFLNITVHRKSAPVAEAGSKTAGATELKP